MVAQMRGRFMMGCANSPEAFENFLRRMFASLRIPQKLHSEPNCGAIPTGEPGRSKVEDKSRSILAYFACIMACSAYRNTRQTSKLGTCTTRKLTPLPVQHPS